MQSTGAVCIPTTNPERSIMSKIAVLASILVLTAATSSASAEPGGLTRAQVKAALADAQRTGDIVANGETGMKFNELYPGVFRAAAAVPASASRAQVKAELVQARRTGDITENGETGAKLNEMYAHRYPTQPIVVGKSRAEVKAELAEAVRTGDVLANGELGLKRNELSPGLYPMQGRESGTRALAASPQPGVLAN